MAIESFKYKRNLPHIQNANGSYFVTFCTWQRWTLPEGVRAIVLNCCKFVHAHSAFIHVALVMPDHVHLLISPYDRGDGQPESLYKILKGLKGVSAHRINLALARTGHVWHPESFDHKLRRIESAESKMDYVLQNPVRRQIVDNPEDYPWTWCGSSEQQCSADNPVRDE